MCLLRPPFVSFYWDERVSISFHHSDDPAEKRLLKTLIASLVQEILKDVLLGLSLHSGVIEEIPSGLLNVGEGAVPEPQFDFL